MSSWHCAIGRMSHAATPVLRPYKVGRQRRIGACEAKSTCEATSGATVVATAALPLARVVAPVVSRGPSAPLPVMSSNPSPQVFGMGGPGYDLFGDLLSTEDASLGQGHPPSTAPSNSHTAVAAVPPPIAPLLEQSVGADVSDHDGQVSFDESSGCLSPSHHPPEDRRRNRAIRNRQSAQASRERKRQYVQELESSRDALQAETRNLRARVHGLEYERGHLVEELARLRRDLEQLQGLVGGIMSAAPVNSNGNNNNSNFPSHSLGRSMSSPSPSGDPSGTRPSDCSPPTLPRFPTPTTRDDDGNHQSSSAERDRVLSLGLPAITCPSTAHSPFVPSPSGALADALLVSPGGLHTLPGHPPRLVHVMRLCLRYRLPSQQEGSPPPPSPATGITAAAPSPPKTTPCPPQTCGAARGKNTLRSPLTRRGLRMTWLSTPTCVATAKHTMTTSPCPCRRQRAGRCPRRNSTGGQRLRNQRGRRLRHQLMVELKRKRHSGRHARLP